MYDKQLVTIRPTVYEDRELFVEWLLQDDVLQGFPMCNEKEVQNAVAIWKYYIDKGLSLTACYDGKPVGASNLYMHDVDKMHHQSLFVIILDEKFRGKGIGYRLLQAIIGLGKEKGLVVIHLEVYDKNPALHLYRRVGFKEYGRHLRYLKDASGRYYNKVLMSMEL